MKLTEYEIIEICKYYFNIFFPSNSVNTEFGDLTWNGQGQDRDRNEANMQIKSQVKDFTLIKNSPLKWFVVQPTKLDT